jgi:glycosyltransferase involved in cell wall biosynthesis
MTSISVVIPALNDAAMLEKCLAALAVQSRPADEIIVVDNGSTDDTAAVARHAGARVLDQPVPGIFPSTAAGFDAAGGDILARLDADSVPPVDWLARVEVEMADGALTALTGPGEFYGGSRLTHWFGRTFYIGGYFWFVSIVLGHAPLFGSNLALRADAWRRIRGSVHSDRRDVHDDFDLAFHLTPDMTVRYDPTLLVGISSRPFGSWSGFARRIRWAFGTLALNWREEGPLERRARRREFELGREARQARA